MNRIWTAQHTNRWLPADQAAAALSNPHAKCLTAVRVLWMVEWWSGGVMSCAVLCGMSAKSSLRPVWLLLADLPTYLPACLPAYRSLWQPNNRACCCCCCLYVWAFYSLADLSATVHRSGITTTWVMVGINTYIQTYVWVCSCVWAHTTGCK